MSSIPNAPLPFDPQRLRRYLSEVLPDLQGPMRLARIGGGQSNPTFFVSFDNRSLVLRKQPDGPLLPSAHAVDREYRVLAALASTPVPVPAVRLYCADRDVIGTPFYVMDRVEGRVLSGLGLPEVPVAERRAHVMAAAETLASLHAADWAALGLRDYGKPGNFFERQVARWTRQWHASKLHDNADIDTLIAWLPANLPAGDATTIAHGDYRIGNLMFHPTEARVVAVLDWELSTLGHPLADLSYFCLAWCMRPGEFDGVAGRDLAQAGLPTMDEFVAHYQRSGGHPQPLLPFHLAFSMFRFAVILEGVAARARSGNAASGDAAEVGAQALAFARRAVAEIHDHDKSRSSLARAFGL